MNETLKQNRLLREQGEDGSFLHPSDDRSMSSDLQKHVSTCRKRWIIFWKFSSFCWQTYQLIVSLVFMYWVPQVELSNGKSALYSLPQDQIGSQKAISLPSSPHDYRSQNSERSGHSGYLANDEMVSTWHKVLQSSMFNNKPLLPYHEWNIDFSEVTVGTRVGIGKCHFQKFAIIGSNCPFLLLLCSVYSAYVCTSLIM